MSLKGRKADKASACFLLQGGAHYQHMELPRRAAFSSERLKKMALLDRLRLEEETVGSPLAYLQSLSVYYQSVPDHIPNMLQLQRIARIATDPHGAGGREETEAFYWGEILGYTLCDRMIGEPWHQMSYRLLNHDILSMPQQFDVETSPPGEKRQLIATMLQGKLEELGYRTFPPMIDDYIEEKVVALSDNLRVQHYMALGFRYMVMQVAETATEETVTANQFFDMMARNEIEDLHPEPESLDDVREYLMERFADHITSVGEFDEHDDEALETIVDYLHTRLNRDLMKSGRIESGDDIIAHGDVLYVGINGETGQCAAYVLPPGMSLRGTVDALAVVEVPTNEMIAKIREHAGSPEEGIDNFQTNVFGVTLLLKEAQVIDEDGTGEIIAHGGSVCVVLNNPALRLTGYKI